MMETIQPNASSPAAVAVFHNNRVETRNPNLRATTVITAAAVDAPGLAANSSDINSNNPSAAAQFNGEPPIFAPDLDDNRTETRISTIRLSEKSSADRQPLSNNTFNRVHSNNVSPAVTFLPTI